jgi:4-amino-4-deoxy-L-arabinose transferase-like glycosyltransferase
MVAAISAGAWLSRKEWRVPLGWLLSPAATMALLILLLSGGWALALAPLSLSLVAWALGRQTLCWLIGENDANDRLEWIVSLCLGSGVMALLWLGLGSLDRLRPAALAASLLLATAISWRQLWSLARRLAQAPIWLATKVSLLNDATMISLGGLLTMLAVVNLIAALAPDIGFDSTRFHLAMADLFVRQGSLDPSPMSHYFYEQIPVQTLYAGITAFSGVIAAKFLHFVYGVLASSAAYAMAARFTGRARYGALAAAIFSVATLVWWLCGVGYVDLAITFFFFATICALVRWVETDRLGWIIAAGLCAGIAVPAKLTNLAVVPIIALVILGYKFGSWRRLFKASVACALASFLIWAPWLWRSYLLTGNPIFPYGNNIFRSELIEPSAVFASVVFGVGTGWKSLLWLPFALTFRPGKFVEGGEFGAHLLAFSPALLLLWWRRWRSESLNVVVGATAVFVALWIFAFNQNLRYLLPALPLLAVLLTVGCHRLAQWCERERLVLTTMAAALFLSAIGGVLSPEAWWLAGESGSGLPYKVVLGLETRENYLFRHINGSNALRYLNRVYGDRAQIFAISGGDRLYSQSPVYFWHDVHTVLPLRNRLWDTDLLSNPSMIYERLSQLGFTHLLLNTTTYEMSQPEDRRLPILRKSFLDSFARLEYADHGAALYKLEPRAEAIQDRSEKLRSESLIDRNGALAVGWETSGSPRLDMSGKEACGGKAALGVDGNRAYLSPLIPVEPGRTYRLPHRAFIGEQRAAT